MQVDLKLTGVISLPPILQQAVTIVGFAVVNAKLMPVPREAPAAPTTPAGPMARAA